jgi:hypothetical protein
VGVKYLVQRVATVCFKIPQGMIEIEKKMFVAHDAGSSGHGADICASYFSSAKPNVYSWLY